MKVISFDGKHQRVKEAWEGSNPQQQLNTSQNLLELDT